MRSVDPAASRPPWDVHEATESFCFRDAHGQALADVWDLWFSGAYPNARAIQGSAARGRYYASETAVAARLPSAHAFAWLRHARCFAASLTRQHYSSATHVADNLVTVDR